MPIDLRNYARVEGADLSFGQPPLSHWGKAKPSHYLAEFTEGSIALDRALRSALPAREVVLTRNSDGKYNMHVLRNGLPPTPVTQERCGVGKLESLGQYIGDLIAREQSTVVRAVNVQDSEVFIVYREGPNTKPHEVDQVTKAKLAKLEKKQRHGFEW